MCVLSVTLIFFLNKILNKTLRGNKLLPTDIGSEALEKNGQNKLCCFNQWPMSELPHLYVTDFHTSVATWWHTWSLKKQLCLTDEGMKNEHIRLGKNQNNTDRWAGIYWTAMICSDSKQFGIIWDSKCYFCVPRWFKISKDKVSTNPWTLKASSFNELQRPQLVPWLYAPYNIPIHSVSGTKPDIRFQPH